MFTLDIVSPDKVLRHAVREQLELLNLGQVYESGRLGEALSRKASFLLLDVAAIEGGVESLPGGVFLFVLGDLGGYLDPSLVMEAFPKPLRLGYLMARLQFYQKVLQQRAGRDYVLGSYNFMPREKKLTTKSGASIKLTDKEASLIEYLCQAAEPVPREELLAAIWGYDEKVNTHTLETHIYRLRRLIAEDIFLVKGGCVQINPTWAKP